MANVQMIIELMTDLAPQKNAYKWDNVGIQVGSTSSVVNNVLLTLDINEEVLKEAEKNDCEMIISHHPLIFNELSSIHDQTETGKIIMEAIKKDLTIYSAHTNLDVANGGLNDYLADMLNIKNLNILDIKEKSNYYKLVVFGPKENLQKIRKNILKTGAGEIGNYSYTSFFTNGEGTFKPEKGSEPYLGEQGKMAKVDEFRFETIIKEDNINKVVNKIKEIHPYEEVAYDIIPLVNQFSSGVIGLGRIGELKQSMSLVDYVKYIKNKLNIPFLRYYGFDDDKIKKVAVCSGSGADLIGKAKFSGADLYITGDVKYHEAQKAEQLGLNLVDAGHYGTEKIVKNLLYSYLTDKVIEKKFNVNFLKSKINTNPWKYI